MKKKICQYEKPPLLKWEKGTIEGKKECGRKKVEKKCKKNEKRY